MPADMNMKYIFSISGLPKDADYNRLPFGRQIEYRHDIDAFKTSAKSIHVSAKRRTNKSAFAEFKRLYQPAEWFYIDRDESMRHDDSFQVWYRR